MRTVSDILLFLDKFAPFSSQMDWDNSGLLIGDSQNTINKVLLALDATNNVIEEAIQNNCQLIITHHPIIFGNVKNIKSVSPIYKAINSNICVLSSHTCLDIASGGVNDCICKALKLNNIQRCNDDFGLLRIGTLENAMTSNEFLDYLSDKLGIKSLRCSSFTKNVEKVAVCGGSGAEFYNHAFSSGADVYVTSDIKYNYFIDFDNFHLFVVDAGHFGTEHLIINHLYNLLKTEFKDIDFIISNNSKDVISYWNKK